MNEECIGYPFSLFNKLKTSNYIVIEVIAFFLKLNGLTFQSFMCVRQLVAK